MSAFGLSDALAREGWLFASLLGVLLLGAILVFALRGRSLPVCWNCGHHSVRRSHSHRLLDAFAGVCSLCPYRCDKCLQRFYCFRSRHVPPPTRSRSKAAGS
jgi:hypothetical protein